jgi:Holliday junction resolvasome RuvABC endonuclease subunit
VTLIIGGPTVRVVGLDLSIVSTGVCLPSGQLISIQPKGAGDNRLVHFRQALDYYLAQAVPDVAVIEEVPPSMRGGTITLVRLGLVHGIARELLAGCGIPFAYMQATKLKKYATGGGGAQKQAMVDAAFDAGYTPRNGDEADAFWCWAAGMHHYTRTPVTVKHGLSAELLKPVGWPDLTATARRRRSGTR